MTQLLTALLFLQGDTALESLQKLAKAIEGATAVKVKLSVETVVSPNGGGQVARFENVGELWVGRPEKIYFRSSRVPEDKARYFLILVDEHNLFLNAQVSPRLDQLGCPRLRAKLLNAFALGGAAGLHGWVGETLLEQKEESRGVGWIIAQRPVGDDKGADTRMVDPTQDGDAIRYGLSFPRSGAEYHIKLWLDPKSGMPAKRIVTQRVPEAMITRTETYTSFELNREFTDDQFGMAMGEAPEWRVLRKLEDVILRSKSLHLKFIFKRLGKVPSEGDFLSPIQGELHLKAGRKSRLVMDGFRPELGGSLLVSDGERSSKDLKRMLGGGGRSRCLSVNH